jgi:cobalt/nickel transport system permease protein
MENKIPSYLLETVNDQQEFPKSRGARLSFPDKTIMNSAAALKAIYVQAENASAGNFIQRLHPGVKLFLLIYTVIVISIINRPWTQLIITVFIFSFYLIGRLKIFEVYKKIIFLATFFGLIIVFPASLNIITQGNIILNIITFNRPMHFLIYNIPQHIGFTENGIKVVSLIFLRILNSISIAMLVIFTTSFPAFIKSFKILGIPDTFLMIISLAYKYIFILSRAIEETYFALKSRISENVGNKRIMELISGRIFFIFKKSMLIYESTYLAMVSRGYQGRVLFHSQKKVTTIDFITLIIVVLSGILIIYL